MTSRILKAPGKIKRRAWNFFLLSKHYLEKTDKKVLICRAAIIDAVYNDYEIPADEDLDRLITILKKLEVTSTKSIIRHNLRMYHLTENALRGIEEDKKYLESLKGTEDAFLATPYWCLIDEGWTWEEIEKYFNRSENEKAIAEAISQDFLDSKKDQKLPDYLELACQEATRVIQGYFSNLSRIIETNQAGKCNSCEKARKNASYLDQLTECRAELQSRDSQIIVLKDSLLAKNSQIDTLTIALEAAKAKLALYNKKVSALASEDWTKE